MTFTDQNGKKLYRNLHKEQDGTWGVNVFWGTAPLITTKQRHYYRTHAEARRADISDDARRGLLRTGPYEDTEAGQFDGGRWYLP